MQKKAPRKPDGPAVSFQEVPAGRETLAAISRDGVALRASGVRTRTATKHYGDRISNAPGAVSPKIARAMDTSPEVTVTLASAGRETYALIAEDHRREVPDIEVTASADDGADDDELLDTLEIERLHTFTVVAELEHLNSDRQKYRLVERRLLRQMAGATLDDVTRVEVLEGDVRGHVSVRVWTRVLD